MSAPLWTSAEAARATAGVTDTAWEAQGVSIDTRTIAAGDLFVALTDQRDGHDFVAEALSKGAAAAMVTHRPAAVEATAPLLIVDNVLTALEGLAKAARTRTRAQIVAVTGSVGKTSTKDMLHHVLTAQGTVHAAVKSLNNHWGVPLTLARMPAATDFAIIEIGMNHSGEITPLSRLARPDVAIVTTVAAAHMAAFESIKDVARAKAEIFAGMTAGSGTAILNADDETHSLLRLAAIEGGLEVITFGARTGADWHLSGGTSHTHYQTVAYDRCGDTSLFKLAAQGRHFALNALAVLTAVVAVGGDHALAALRLADWQPPDGRGARLWVYLDPGETRQKLLLIDDAYNANPASMGAALDALAASTPTDGLGTRSTGRRIAFLTDMLELGRDSAAQHRAMAAHAGIDAITKVHAAGPMMRALFDALPADKRGEWRENADALADIAHHLVDAGDVVMVKGSKGSRASIVVDAIKELGQAGRPGGKEKV